LKRCPSLSKQEILSFREGILRDKEAVQYAIMWPYSNGLAEGKINRLKLMKRMMDGRASFETLKKKVILSQTHFN